MPNDTTEQDLIQRAQAGDTKAFQQLVERGRPRLRGVVRKMIGHPEDSDDVVQETLVKAWNAIGSFKGEAAFSTWLVSIGSRTAIDFLRDQKRWRGEAQVAYANLCASSEIMSQEVMARTTSPEFSYEVREHISYCFSCVGRSLPPDELAALVLSDVVALSAREASTALGISDSVLRHRLASARRSMQDRYEGLCALVSKTGICHQCKGLQMIAPEDRTGGAFPDLSDFADRCAVVRDCKTTSMAALHDLFWRRTKDIEEQGLGSTEPDSDCGIEDDAG